MAEHSDPPRPLLLDESLIGEVTLFSQKIIYEDDGLFDTGIVDQES